MKIGKRNFYGSPNSGWISFYLNEPADIAHAIALFRQAFELAAELWSRKRAPDGYVDEKSGRRN